MYYVISCIFTNKSVGF